MKIFSPDLNLQPWKEKRSESATQKREKIWICNPARRKDLNLQPWKEKRSESTTLKREKIWICYPENRKDLNLQPLKKESTWKSAWSMWSSAAASLMISVNWWVMSPLSTSFTLSSSPRFSPMLRIFSSSSLMGLGHEMNFFKRFMIFIGHYFQYSLLVFTIFDTVPC